VKEDQSKVVEGSINIFFLISYLDFKKKPKKKRKKKERKKTNHFIWTPITVHRPNTISSRTKKLDLSIKFEKISNDKK